MTDDSAPAAVPAPPLPSKDVRLGIVCAVLLFCILVIGFCLLRGDPANSLHQSALAWAWTLIGAVTAFYLGAAGWDRFLDTKR